MNRNYEEEEQEAFDQALLLDAFPEARAELYMRLIANDIEIGKRLAKLEARVLELENRK